MDINYEEHKIKYGEQDTYIIYDFLNKINNINNKDLNNKDLNNKDLNNEDLNNADLNNADLNNEDLNFEKIKNEICWTTMNSKGSPVPRLVCLQGETKLIDNKLYEPLYRHPIDKQPPLNNFSDTTLKISNILKKKFNINFNHVLIQYYRNGDDNIGEHSDKTLDIEKNTPILNFSIGATRTMTLRYKNDKTKKETIQLKHGSLFVLGLETNKKWLHCIKPNKKIPKLKTEDELINDGQRISFTFRAINTYINYNIDSYDIIGQGKPIYKNINDHDELLHAFSNENNQSDFDWDKNYGLGFNTIGLST
jgi:alkylated DNA repair dioxygenase AlkB